MIWLLYCRIIVQRTGPWLKNGEAQQYFHVLTITVTGGCSTLLYFSCTVLYYYLSACKQIVHQQQMQDVVYGQHAWMYVIMWTKLALVSLFCKSQRFKQQISKFYPHVISTEASYHIYTSQWLVINVWPIFIKFGTVTQIGPLQGTDR